MNIHDLVDAWRCKNLNEQEFTWNNSSMKILCRLDYFFISKDMQSAITKVRILPNIFSDHFALTLPLSSQNNETKRGPGFWKFSNSVLTDKDYVETIYKQIPEFFSKYHQLTDKGLFWEMIKMEIRAVTIAFANKKPNKNEMRKKTC